MAGRGSRRDTIRSVLERCDGNDGHRSDPRARHPALDKKFSPCQWTRLRAGIPRHRHSFRHRQERESRVRDEWLKLPEASQTGMQDLRCGRFSTLVACQSRHSLSVIAIFCIAVILIMLLSIALEFKLRFMLCHSCP